MTRFGVCRASEREEEDRLGISSPGQLLILCTRPGSHWRGYGRAARFAPQGRASFRGYRRQSRQAPHRFGHAGDGNIRQPALRRVWILTTRRTAAAHHALDDAALEFGGSLSGEHGGGCLKDGQAARLLDELEAMRAVRRLFDPQGILVREGLLRRVPTVEVPQRKGCGAGIPRQFAVMQRSGREALVSSCWKASCGAVFGTIGPEGSVPCGQARVGRGNMFRFSTGALLRKDCL